MKSSMVRSRCRKMSLIISLTYVLYFASNNKNNFLSLERSIQTLVYFTLCRCAASPQQ